MVELSPCVWSGSPYSSLYRNIGFSTGRCSHVCRSLDRARLGASGQQISPEYEQIIPNESANCKSAKRECDSRNLFYLAGSSTVLEIGSIISRFRGLDRERLICDSALLELQHARHNLQHPYYAKCIFRVATSSSAEARVDNHRNIYCENSMPRPSCRNYRIMRVISPEKSKFAICTIDSGQRRNHRRKSLSILSINYV